MPSGRHLLFAPAPSWNHNPPTSSTIRHVKWNPPKYMTPTSRYVPWATRTVDSQLTITLSCVVNATNGAAALCRKWRCIPGEPQELHNDPVLNAENALTHSLVVRELQRPCNAAQRRSQTDFEHSYNMDLSRTLLYSAYPQVGHLL